MRTDSTMQNVRCRAKHSDGSRNSTPRKKCEQILSEIKTCILRNIEHIYKCTPPLYIYIYTVGGGISFKPALLYSDSCKFTFKVVSHYVNEHNNTKRATAREELEDLRSAMHGDNAKLCKHTCEISLCMEQHARCRRSFFCTFFGKWNGVVADIYGRTPHLLLQLQVTTWCRD